jgi:hypothetical protein
MPPSARRDGGHGWRSGLELVPPYEGAGPGLCYPGVWGAEDPLAGHGRLPLAVVRGGAAPLT